MGVQAKPPSVTTATAPGKTDIEAGSVGFVTSYPPQSRYGSESSPPLYGIRRARCGKRFGPTNRTPLPQARQTIKAGPSNRSSRRASLAPMSEPSTMSMFALQLGQPPSASLLTSSWLSSIKAF